MRWLRVGATALDQTPLDWDGNLANILGAIRDARAADVAVLCLPELCVTGYGCEDAFFSPDVLETAWEVLEEIVPATRGMIVSVGLPVLFRGALFNCAALVCDGALRGLVAKRWLAGDGLHYEPRWFKRWPEGKSAWLERGEQRWPIGDVHFDCGGLRIGFEICEDAWVASRPGANLARRGVDLLLNPSASHFAFGKGEVRERFVLEGSRAFSLTYVYANLLGNEAGRTLYDGECLIASGGQMLARGQRFSYAPRQLTVTSVDVDATRVVQSRTASFRPDLGDAEDCVKVRFDVPWTDPVARAPGDAPAAEAWDIGAFRKEEEFDRAVALGLFGYLRKSRSRGFVVSLSGGADSAACATLVADMVAHGVAELGAAGLAERLGVPVDADHKVTVGRLLTTVYQGTANSGDVTRGAARAVAAAVGATHHEVDVEALVHGYRERVEGALGRGLGWGTDDLALQNIQARARAPLAWMLANVEGKLLITTSNRSEAAVGYATMDGDTAGGLAPLAGIDKAWLRSWLRWREAQGPAGLGPISALRAVNQQQPTAELRPAGDKQTDEADLMPYPVLDAIEAAAIRDKLGPIAVWQRLKVEFPSREPDLLVRDVTRFFELWCRNQWKRERYAPGFHLDDRDLDPRAWCRFPILSGGYRRELRALAARAQRERRA